MTGLEVDCDFVRISTLCSENLEAFNKVTSGMKEEKNNHIQTQAVIPLRASCKTTNHSSHYLADTSL